MSKTSVFRMILLLTISNSHSFSVPESSDVFKKKKKVHCIRLCRVIQTGFIYEIVLSAVLDLSCFGVCAHADEGRQEDVEYEGFLRGH